MLTAKHYIMSMKEIASLRHARRYAEYTANDLRDHYDQCATCSPGRDCSLALTLKRKAETAADDLKMARKLRSEQRRK